MIKADNLVKKYGNFELDISMEVQEGYITGLVGKNGAGKSTAIKLILGLIRPDSGSITVLGKMPCELNGKDKQHNAKQSAQSCRPSGRTTSRRHNAADHPKEKRQQNGNQHHQAHTHGGKLDVEKLCHIKRGKKQKT